MIKDMKPDLKVTALFDPNIDNGGGVAFKEAGLVEIIKDYNESYGQDFTIPTFAKMKRILQHDWLIRNRMSES